MGPRSILGLLICAAAPQIITVLKTVIRTYDQWCSLICITSSGLHNHFFYEKWSWLQHQCRLISCAGNTRRNSLQSPDHPAYLLNFFFPMTWLLCEDVNDLNTYFQGVVPFNGVQVMWKYNNTLCRHKAMFSRALYSLDSIASVHSIFLERVYSPDASPNQRNKNKNTSVWQ